MINSAGYDFAMKLTEGFKRCALMAMDQDLHARELDISVHAAVNEVTEYELKVNGYIVNVLPEPAPEGGKENDA